MKLGKHISELLHEREQVTLPDFGTFSKKYTPARFIPEKKIVEAPQKTAEFNEEPKTGGTALIEFMASRTGKGSDEIRQFLEDIVREINLTLDAGKTVELENLGRFHKDPEGKLQFDPDTSTNYLDEAPGADEVKTPEPKSGAALYTKPPSKEYSGGTPSGDQEKESKPGFQDLPHTAFDETFPDSPAKDDNQNQTTMKEDEEKKRIAGPIKWLLIIGIPLLVILLVLLLNFNYFFGDQGLISTWHIFSTEQEELVMPPDEEELDEAMAEVDEEELTPDPDIPDPAEEAPDPAMLEPEPGRPVYYLVVGSFRNREKAGELARQLQQQGAERANVLGRTPSHYHRVSYGFYYDLDEASRQKETLPPDLKEVAWILHR